MCSRRRLDRRIGSQILTETSAPHVGDRRRGAPSAIEPHGNLRTAGAKPSVQHKQNCHIYMEVKAHHMLFRRLGVQVRNKSAKQ